MKLSVSNIAWKNEELEEHLELLQSVGCEGVEIAPSIIWEEPIHANHDDIEGLKRLIEKYDLIIPAFHALLFTRPDLNLFGDRVVRNETLNYIKKLVELAGQLSVGVLVFGSPPRRRVEGKPYSECYSMAVELFKEVAQKAYNCNTCFCIEPLGPEDGCDFITNAEEGYQLVQDVNHPGFGLHLDAKAMMCVNDDFQIVFKKYGSILKHFHVGDPGLKPPGFTGVDHSIAGKALLDSDYKGFISIEMRKGFGESQEVIKNAVSYVVNNYFTGKMNDH